MFFFNKNHGLTPLQNFDVLDFVRTSLFRSKKHSFLSRISKNGCLWHFFLEKKQMRKRSINPLAKCPFFRIFQNFTFQVKKAFFTIQNIKICFFLTLFAQKKHLRRRSNFCQKPRLTPLQNVRFFDFART